MSSRKRKVKEIAGNRSVDENTKAVTMMQEESHFGFDDLPIGFRFLPTDEELIRYYLFNKVSNKPLPLNKFIDLNIYCYNPDQLAEIYGGREENEPMYFFSPRERKYANGKRPNRIAGTGHWRASGKEKHIPAMGPTIGFERALGFHEGKSRKDKKTKWIMHEYRVNSQDNVPSTRTPMKLDDWVLCKIYENGRGQKGKSTHEKQDNNPSETSFPHHDHADQGGRRARAIISSPPRTTLLPINQVPDPVPNINYDLSNALNSSCQFDQYYSGQMISAFGEHDHHDDPIACGKIGLHHYANLADDPFFNTNITRPDADDHHVFAAPVPYLANYAFDWCDIDDDQGRRKDDDDRHGFQLSGPAFNDPLGNLDNFAHTDDALIFYDARPSSGFAGDLDQSDQLLHMFDASCSDDNQNFDLGSTGTGDNMFSENTEPNQNTEPDRTS